MLAHDLDRTTLPDPILLIFRIILTLLEPEHLQDRWDRLAYCQGGTRRPPRCFQPQDSRRGCESCCRVSSEHYQINATAQQTLNKIHYERSGTSEYQVLKSSREGLFSPWTDWGWRPCLPPATHASMVKQARRRKRPAPLWASTASRPRKATSDFSLQVKARPASRGLSSERRSACQCR